MTRTTMKLSESEKKNILSLYYKGHSSRNQYENLLENFSRLLNEQVWTYYYTYDGKFGETQKGVIPTGGIDAKYVFPERPYQKQSFPTTINTNELNQGKEYEKNNKQSQSQKQIAQQRVERPLKSIEIGQQVEKACKANPKSDYVILADENQMGREYLCHRNYCNNHRDKKFDPKNELCKNNTLAAKIEERGWDGFFEDFREAMNSVVGVGIQAILDGFGIGAVAVEVAWGMLLAWDIHQASIGNADWINLLTDLAGIMTAGLGAKAVRELFKTIGAMKGSYQVVLGTVKKYPEYFKWLTYANFESLFNSMVTGLNVLSNKFTFFKSIFKGVSKFLSSLDEIIKVAVDAILSKEGGELLKTGAETAYDKASDIEQKTTGTNYLASNREKVAKGVNYVDKATSILR